LIDHDQVLVASVAFHSPSVFILSSTWPNRGPSVVSPILVLRRTFHFWQALIPPFDQFARRILGEGNHPHVAVFALYPVPHVSQVCVWIDQFNLAIAKVRAHFSTGVFLDGEVVYMLMDEGAA